MNRRGRQKGHRLSEETKRKISEAHKGKLGTRLGAHLSEETKLKMSEARKVAWIKGKYPRHSKLATCQKQSAALKGHRNWMLGKHWHISEAAKEKHSEAMKKVVAHKIATLGYCNSPETIQKMRLSMLGKHHTEERNLKMRMLLKGRHLNLSEEARKKRILAHKGIPMTEEAKRKSSNSHKEYNKTDKGKEHLRKAHAAVVSPSKPQLELFELIRLKYPEAELDYTIKTNRSHRFADIAVPSKKYDFEFDGKFWHEVNGGKENDEKRDLELAEVGWKTFRVNNEILEKMKIDNLGFLFL